MFPHVLCYSNAQCVSYWHARYSRHCCDLVAGRLRHDGRAVVSDDWRDRHRKTFKQEAERDRWEIEFVSDVTDIVADYRDKTGFNIGFDSGLFRSWQSCWAQHTRIRRAVTVMQCPKILPSSNCNWNCRPIHTLSMHLHCVYVIAKTCSEEFLWIENIWRSDVIYYVYCKAFDETFNPITAYEDIDVICVVCRHLEVACSENITLNIYSKLIYQSHLHTCMRHGNNHTDRTPQWLKTE